MIPEKIKFRNSIFYIVPFLLAIIQIVQSYIDSPAFITRIDPEYICLLNGLNVSILEFNQIGYIDLPGSPFIVLTGILIRITHLFVGQGPIYLDVISRPELYLESLSALLMLLTTTILIWGGKRIYSDKRDIMGILILQSTFLLSGECLHLPTRYMADRILPVYVFIFAVYTILYVKNEISDKRYAILSGIILGIGLVTKINFLPILGIPILVLFTTKDRLIYLLSLSISSVIAFLPIIDKFQYFKKFIFSIITHDGKYGGGESQIFNFGKYIQHLKAIQELNLSYSILFGLTILLLALLIAKPKYKSGNKKHFRILIAVCLATLVETIMISKQLKSYYFAPVLALSGLIGYVIWDLSKQYSHIKPAAFNLLIAVMLTGLIVPNLSVASHTIETIKKIKIRQQTVEYINQVRKPSDWYFLEPSWKSGPLVENGLMWGISYVAGRKEHYNEFKKAYPRVVAFEGKNNEISQFRCGPADTKTMMESGDDIFLISLPGDQTQKRINQMMDLSNKYNQPIQIDTIFVNKNNNDLILRAKHIEL